MREFVDIERKNRGEICIIPGLLSSCSHAFSNRPSSNIISTRSLTNAEIGVKDKRISYDSSR